MGEVSRSSSSGFWLIPRFCMAELPVVWTKGLGDISFAMFKPRGKMALRIQAFATLSHQEVLFFP